MDYGSGMELNFLCWLCVLGSHLFLCALCLPDCHCRICLEQLGVVRESDYAALVVKVFWKLVSSSSDVPFVFE